MMHLTNTGTCPVVLNLGDGVEIAAGKTEAVDGAAWAALKSNPVVASWVNEGRIVESGGEAPVPKTKKVTVKDADQ